MDTIDAQPDSRCEHRGGTLVDRPSFGIYRAKCISCKAWGPESPTEEEATRALRDVVSVAHAPGGVGD